MKKETKYNNIAYLNLTKPRLKQISLRQSDIRIINIGKCKIYLANESSKKNESKSS
ncbi:MAG: hypothetical protein ACO2XZ_00200 [Rickettsiales bacterium]